MLLGKKSGFWCSRLKYSCGLDGPGRGPSVGSNEFVSEFVWFESRDRRYEEDMKAGNVRVNATFASFDNFNLVWFEENKSSVDQTETVARGLNPSYKELSKTQNQQLRKIIETNPNIF